MWWHIRETEAEGHHNFKANLDHIVRACCDKQTKKPQTKNLTLILENILRYEVQRRKETLIHDPTVNL